MSTKKFLKDRARLHKAAEIAVGNSKKKSVLILFTDDKSYSVIYSGRKMNIDLQTQMQHDQNIMHILLDNDEAFQIIGRIFTPVQRYRRRQQKKVNYAAITILLRVNYGSVLYFNNKIYIMRIILSKRCEHMSGSIGRGYGYCIQGRKGVFYVKRNSSGNIPYDGHLGIIIACANMALLDLHIDDIELQSKELKKALIEARVPIVGKVPRGKTLNAKETLELLKQLTPLQI